MYQKMDKPGILSAVILTAATGAGLACHQAGKWLATSSEHLNVYQHCFKLENATICTDLESTTKGTICKFILRWSPVYSLIVISLILTSLFRHLRKVMCAAFVLSCILAAAFVTAIMLFANTHYWTSDERSKWSLEIGFLLAILASILSLLAGLLGLVSVQKTREKVEDVNQMEEKKSHMQIKPRKRSGRRSPW